MIAEASESMSTFNSINKQAVLDFLLDYQSQLTATFTALDGRANFREDVWQRAEGGGGQTRILENGAVFEKGGANFSHVMGKTMPASATANRPELAGRGFEAMGVSVVLHPDNPHIPTSHANLRFFLAEKPDAEPVWWFGGGFDLTPYYGDEQDCRLWHQYAKQACDAFGSDVYPEFKQWCDDYFFLPHRQEQRGIGGLFFDDLNRWSFDQCLAFLRAVGDAYLQAYKTIVERNRARAFTAEQKKFQSYRRGRYVEFNLVYDRGTLFGLQTGGRTESILMSLPPHAEWVYQYTPAKGSAEAVLYSDFLQPRDWLATPVNHLTDS